MRRVAALLAALTLLAAAAGWAVPAAAAPAPVPTNCPRGYKCIYIHSHFNTTGGMYPLSSAATLCSRLPTGFNDKISSVANNGPLIIDLYEHAGCTGRLYRFYSGTADNYVPGNDTYSSFLIHR